ncbi:MAG TPA: competence/damage-inducible protein A [Vicinamibacterales bacterium]|jgi:competence/damage-inducible protein CinA-like protein|nr:competence/damage-inducible protein A [Vicinamibacterales bacterium]
MKACILAIGSEMLTPFRVDTNSLFITERLNAIGYDIRLKAVVGDDVDELADVLRAAIGWADLIVITGGLGPTEDDVTRDAVARVHDMPLEVDEAIADRIRDRFARRGMTMPDINRRQAMVPRGAVVLENPNGTAPGLWIERGRTAMVLLPGPPREMKPMLEGVVRDRLAPRSGTAGLFRRVLKITGRAESDVDAQAQPTYAKWTSSPVPISTTILAVLGQIELHLTAQAANPDAAHAALDAAVLEMQQVLGPSVYSTDGRSLEAVVGDLLRQHTLTIAVAESCTGGLLASRLTDVPGSSDYVERGVVCYSNRSKTELADVPAALIAEHGAVSEPVARAMAEGIRSRAGTNIGIGITGIAGPGGGTPEKPVGTVSVAVIGDDQTRVRTFQFIGGRDMVKFQAAQAALNMTRLAVMKIQGPREWAERR